MRYLEFEYPLLHLSNYQKIKNKNKNNLYMQLEKKKKTLAQPKEKC